MDWSTLIAVVVGGAITIGASWSEARHARKLATAAAKEDRDAAAAASNRETAVMMLEQLAQMHVNFGRIRESGPWYIAPVLGTNPGPPPPENPAVGALRELQRLNSSRALLMPDSIRDRWYELTLLIDEYRDARVDGDEGERAWSDQKVNRAGVDVVGYMTYVRQTLVTFVKTQEILPEVPPPLLRRDDLEPWKRADS